MASKRGERRRQCGKKHPLTKEVALKRASYMSKKHPGESFDAYQCEHCGAWHVGHRTKRVREQIHTRRSA